MASFESLAHVLRAILLLILLGCYPPFLAEITLVALWGAGWRAIWLVVFGLPVSIYAGLLLLWRVGSALAWWI